MASTKVWTSSDATLVYSKTATSTTVRNTGDITRFLDSDLKPANGAKEVRIVLNPGETYTQTVDTGIDWGGPSVFKGQLKKVIVVQPTEVSYSGLDDTVVKAEWDPDEGPLRMPRKRTSRAQSPEPKKKRYIKLRKP